MQNNKVIEVKKLEKSFGKEKAVDGLSFDVYKGDIFAFLGSNGSGKTTTIRCILDIYQQESGEALIKGKKFNHSMNSLIGYLPEERGLYTRAKLNDLFMYFAALRDIPKDKARSLTKTYLKRVDLYSHKDKKVSQLSSGMQQKVQLGLAMLHDPEILILDEPFKGLDPLNRQMYIELFKELKEKGTTILYSTHVIDEAQKLSDRLVMISKGQRKVYGSITDVRKEYGNNIIHLDHKNEVPVNPNLYKIKQLNGHTELVPNKSVSTNEILKYLIDNNVEVLKYKLDYPSLNEIFINVTTNKLDE